MNNTNVPTITMITIRETAKRSGLAENYIRRLVHERAIVFHKAGNKALINWEKFQEFLNTPEPPAPM